MLSAGVAEIPISHPNDWIHAFHDCKVSFLGKDKKALSRLKINHAAFMIDGMDLLYVRKGKCLH